jgi:prepilin-type processing-associated H-X9-DG protein
MLLEANRDIASWFEPRDLTFDEAVGLLTTTPRWEEGDGHYVAHGLLTKPSITRNVAFADGSVRSLRMPLPRELAVALLTAHGGEQISNKLLDKLSRPQFNYERCYAFAAFVVLACLPGRWLNMKHPLDSHEPETTVEK